MPESRPMNVRYGTYDDPPSTETSNPRTRRERLRRALQGTEGLAREVVGLVDNDRRTRTSSLLSPVNRRRQRSPSNNNADAVPPTIPSVHSEWRRVSKRKKLEDPSSTPKQGIKYGYYGQVEPGRLKLELVSCDGGEHIDPRHPEAYLGAKNLLRHDKSVYCSEQPSSNIIVRHADETPFCLEKLHIVGPEHGFTAPVREGLVYISMTLHDLQKYLDPPPHARRRGVHSPPYLPPNQRLRPSRIATRSQSSSPEQQLSLSDALRDPAVNAALDTSYARTADAANDLANTSSSPEEADNNNNNYYDEDFGPHVPNLTTSPPLNAAAETADVACDIPTPSHPHPYSNDEEEDADNALHDITVHYSDSDAGPEETSSQAVLDFRLQRLRLMRRRYEIENWDREERWSGSSNGPPMGGFEPRTESGERERSLGRLDALMSRTRERERERGELHLQRVPRPPRYPSRPIFAWTTDGAEGVTAHPYPITPPANSKFSALGEDVERDDHVTMARFRIKRGKHKVAIKFEPGISGRYILMKLWSGDGFGGVDGGRGGGPGGPGLDGGGRNVDVQSVVAKGFGGGRFFPAREVR